MKKHLFTRISPMKTVLLLLLGSFHLPAFSQEDSTIRVAIRSNRWVFTAERSDPPIGRNTGMGTGYEVRCTGDTLVFALPYSGTMQGPARFPEQTGPLDFRSTDFKISKVQKPNGKWIVTIRVRDHYDVNSCTFTFYENGTANLDVMPTNRTPMDFYGSIAPLQ